MWHILTEEQLKAQQEAQKKQFELMIEDAKRRQKMMDDWVKSNPPCSHCGRREPVPPYMLPLCYYQT